MNEYNQVIEIEKIDELMYEDNYKMIIFILSLFIKEIENDSNFFKNDYEFEVIKYGFQGYYPAIGVKYLREEIDYNIISDKLDLQVNETFNEFINKCTLKEFIVFTIDKNDDIQNKLLDFG
jgi:hypothetical protein